jgi:hypothetical protein
VIKTNQIITVCLLLGFVLLGAGCSRTPVSNLTPEQAAHETTLQNGSEIVLRPTVLGLGGGIVKLVGGQTDERIVTISEWVPGVSASLGWTITSSVETEESVAAREAYDEQYSQSPVGVEIPDPPKREYKDVTQEGVIGTDLLESATVLGLPETWPVGDGGSVETSLLWLSKTQYEELVNTRSTELSLGLFDESFVKIEEATSRIGSLVEWIKNVLPLSEDEAQEVVEDPDSSLLTIKADSDWGTFSLLADNVRTTVQTIEAENKFASFSILANPNNPLILELRLTPLARGSLDVLSAEGFVEGFGGYEVVRIKK